MEKQMVIAYIGNGKSANRYHIPFVLTRKDKIRIKKIYTMDHSQDKWAEIPGVQYVEDMDEILKDEEIQVVILSTPHGTHYPLAKKVLEAGKNCVSEKPFTETKEQAEELFALAKEKGLMMQCYQNRRFDSDFLTAQKVIESGLIGDVTEVEISFDYYRPEVPQNREFHPFHSFLYGHACHTLDQVISYFGAPDRVQCDVRQLLGEGKMNDYFDVDLFYGNRLKATVKSSYFRVKPRPAFTVYGMKGMFVKEVKDKQEEHLKMFYMPGQPGFGEDKPSEYGTLTYMDENGVYHEEKVPTVTGDYGRYYDALYETIMNGKEQLVKPWETILQIEIMEKGIRGLK